jgi:hypothetical protein
MIPMLAAESMFRTGLNRQSLCRSFLAMVAPIGFTVSELAARQPKGRQDSRETQLVGSNEPFLSIEYQTQIRN